MNAAVAISQLVNTFFISSGKTGTRFTLRRSVYDSKRQQMSSEHVRNLGVSLDVALKTAEEYVQENFPNAVLCKEVGHIDVAPRRSTVSKKDEKKAYIEALIALGILSNGKYRGLSIEDVPESYLQWSWENRKPKKNPTNASEADVHIIFNHIKAQKLDEKFGAKQ